jgi:hypothetical protein
MSGGVRNVIVSDCTFIGTDVGLRFKSTRGRGGVVENIFVERIQMTGIPTEAILFDLFYGGAGPTDEGATQTGNKEYEKIPTVTEATPAFRKILLCDIVCRGARRAALLQGLPEMPLDGIYLENIDITAKEGIVTGDLAGVILQGVRLKVESGPALTIRNGREMRISGLVVEGVAGKIVQISGSRTGSVQLRGPDINSGSVAIGAEVPRDAVSVK